jgi:RNA polymerase sigma-70 factor (ECF subfamily)
MKRPEKGPWECAPLYDNESADLAAARRGDTAAFTRLVEAYQKPVYNLAYRMLGESTEAEEAAQEAFIRAYTQLATYQPGRKFSSWMFSIASHYCIDLLRRRRLTWLSIEDEEAPAESMVTPELGPEDTMVEQEQEKIVRKMLATLPPDYRLPVILRYWNDLSYEEIAEATHSTVSAVKSKLFRARAMLAERAGQFQSALGEVG